MVVVENPILHSSEKSQSDFSRLTSEKIALTSEKNASTSEKHEWHKIWGTTYISSRPKMQFRPLPAYFISDHALNSVVNPSKFEGNYKLKIHCKKLKINSYHANSTQPVL